jgi:hypothetical protein
MAAPIQHRARFSYPRTAAAVAETLGRDRRFELFYACLVAALIYFGIWAGHLLAFWLAQQMPFELIFVVGPDLPTMVPALLAFVGLLIAGWVHRAYDHRRVRRNFAVHEIPLEFDALYELLPDELRMSSGRVAIAHKWAAVDLIAKATDGWIISANCLTCLIPRDSFADEATEREFVTSVLAHMTDAARQNSAEAIAFTTF